MALIGLDGPGVVLNARTCAWLERYAGLSALRVRVRGTDPEISRALDEVRVAAMTWRGSVSGTTHDTEPEPVALWLSTSDVAAELALSDRAVRKAIAEGRLPATNVAGRWRIAREDLEHWRAARAAA